MIKLVFLNLLLASVIALAFGCASVEPLEERIGSLELAVMELKVLDSRLDLAEERINSLQMQLEDLHGIVLESTSVQVATPPREEVAVISVPVQQPPAAHPSAGTDASRYKEALETLQAGQAQKAEALFRDFVKLYPQSRLAPNAGYWLGEAYYNQKKYDLAILVFQDVVLRYPQHDKAAAALLKTGYAYNAISDTANARFYLQQLLELYPRSEPALLARNALAKLK